MKSRPKFIANFSPYPLARVVLFFILGIIFSYFLPLNFTSLSISSFILLLLALLSLKKKSLGEFLLLSAIFSLGCLSHQNSKILPLNNITNLITPGRNQIWIKAKLFSQIDTNYTTKYKKKSSFILKILSIEERGFWWSASGKIKATLFGEKPDFEFGDILILQGEISPLKDSGIINLNYRQYLARQGISGIFQIRPQTFKIVYQSRNPIKYIFRLKEEFRRIINYTLAYPQRAILSALILGDRSSIPKTIQDSFIKTGTVHILAISGLHVGLVSYIFYLFLKILRIPRQVSYFILIFLVIGYALLTGSRAPVVRASIMTVVYLGGLILRRESNIFNALALACLIILIWQPQQLFEVGFQLSFLSVLAIVSLTPLFEGYFIGKPAGISQKRKKGFSFCYKITRYGIKSILVSFSAWLGITPVVGYYFKIITPMTVLANLMVIPLSFLILAIGFLTLLSGLFSLALANIFSSTNLLSINLLIKATSLLSRIPGGAVSTKIFSFSVVFVYYLSLLLLYSFIKNIKSSLNLRE